MTDIYDGIHQVIKVGDFVAMAHGSYVRQLLGLLLNLVTKVMQGSQVAPMRVNLLTLLVL